MLSTNLNISLIMDSKDFHKSMDTLFLLHLLLIEKEILLTFLLIIQKIYQN